jgi:hypothetical protein
MLSHPYIEEVSLPSECVLLNGLVFRDIHSSPS